MVMVTPSLSEVIVGGAGNRCHSGSRPAADSVRPGPDNIMLADCVRFRG